MTKEPAKSFQGFFDRAEQSLEYLVEGAIIEFTEEMLRIMETEGISRRSLSERMGVQPSYIAKILNGDYNFTLESMVKVAKALNMEFRIHFQPKDSQSVWLDVGTPSKEEQDSEQGEMPES